MSFVSVIIPAYNRASFLKPAVRSVLDQTYRHLEAIVVDDGSNDDTEAIVADLRKKDIRLRYIRHAVNRGAQSARNTGIQNAGGNLIAFLDSDNEWFPDKLEKQVRLFSEGDERLCVVYAGYRELFPEGWYLDRLPALRGDIYEAAMKRWVCDFNTIVVKKTFLDKSGLLNENIRAYQEWDFCIQLSRHGRFDYINEPLVRYRHHEGLSISKDASNNAFGYLDVVEAHRDEILKSCGCYTLSRHYLAVGHHFMLANSLAMGRNYFYRSFCCAPYNIAALAFLAASLLGCRYYQRLHRTKKRLSGKVL